MRCFVLCSGSGLGVANKEVIDGHMLLRKRIHEVGEKLQISIKIFTKLTNLKIKS